MSEVVLSRLLHLLKHHRRDLGSRVALALNLNRVEPVGPLGDRVGNALDLLRHFGHATTHDALDGEDRVLGIRDGLALGDLANETLAVLGEADYRWRSPAALGVGDHHRIAALEYCHH